MIGYGEKVTLTSLAELTEVSVSAVSNWRKRHPDFPQPVMESGQELFSVEEVAQWLSKRKIPRNVRRSGEPPGSTYGDRFARNGGARVQSAPLAPSQPGLHSHTEWTKQLWQVIDVLRGDLEARSAIDFIMALLYLRTVHRELWQTVKQQRSWESINELLQNVPPFSEHGMPLLGAASLDISGDRLAEVIRLVDGIDVGDSDTGALFDVLLENASRDLGRRGGFYTPSSVVKLVVDILDPHAHSTVYDPSCGSGEFLAAAAEYVSDSVFGQAINGRSLQMSSFNLSMHGRAAELRLGEPGIQHGAFPDKQFDLVISNPPFGISLSDGIEMDTWPFGTPSKRETLAWAQIAVGKLKPGGKAAILMPNGTLFSGTGTEIRRRMIEAGVIEGIIALPDRLFSGTAIAVALWILKKPHPADHPSNEILFIDATKAGEIIDRGQRVLHTDDITRIIQEYSNWRDLDSAPKSSATAGFARSVRVEEVRQNGFDLQPQRYVNTELASGNWKTSEISAEISSLRRELNALEMKSSSTRQTIGNELDRLRGLTSASWPRISLGDLCSIQSGPAAVQRERGLSIRGRTPLVLPRNIGRGHIIYTELDSLSLEASEKLRRYELRPDDIVFARSGTLGRHAQVREAEEGWLLGPSCMRLRLEGDQVTPEYLTHYLNSPEAQGWIRNKSQKSTAIPHISSTAMGELEIPLPPVSVQREIAAIMNLANAYVEHQERATSAAQSLRELIFPALA